MDKSLKRAQYSAASFEKKAVLCSGYYGFDNFGDDAVLKVLVDGLNDKYDITVLSANPSKTGKDYYVKSIQSFDYLSVIRALKATDIFISGGGSLLQDVTSFKSLLYYVLLIYLAIFFNKKVIIFAQGIGPLKSKLSEFLVMRALKNCKLVTVRDKESLEIVKQWGIDARLIPDPVFSVNLHSKKHVPVVGIQLRNCVDLEQKFLIELAKEVNANYKNCKIVIYSLQDKIDLEICKDFSKLLEVENFEIKNGLSVQEVIEELSGLEVLIAMRFHAVLIGLRAGVKVLPIAYDKKVRILAEMAGVNYVVLNDEVSLKGAFKNLDNLNVKDIQEKLVDKKIDFSIFDI